MKIDTFHFENYPGVHEIPFIKTQRIEEVLYWNNSKEIYLLKSNYIADNDRTCKIISRISHPNKFH